MQDFYPQLTQALSAIRLHQAYHDGHRKPLNLDIVARYIHNIQVCQSLTPSLHIFEVALRNNIHRIFSAEFTTPQWYDQASFLAPNQAKQLALARQQLQQSGKAASPDRLVAELTLGFWVALFSKAYDAMWSKHLNLLPGVFPNAPRHARNRQRISIELSRLRDFRNRVSHWERITHLSTLRDDKLTIDKVVRWLSPAARCLLQACDKFAEHRGITAEGWARSTSGRCFAFEQIQTVR